MHEIVRPVRIGFLFGLLSLLFGIFWAVYLTVQHESIHRDLEEASKALMEERFIFSVPAPGGHEGHQGHKLEGQGGKDEHMGHDMEGAHEGHAAAGMEKGAREHRAHADPLVAAAHERLTRGHLHAMGLGLVIMAVSFLFAFLEAPDRIKTIASACIGVGGFFYPFSWIIMGYRTTSLGLEGAEGSVLPIVGSSLVLVLAGTVLCLFYLVKGILIRD